MTSVLSGLLAHAGVIAHAHPHGPLDVVGLGIAAVSLAGLAIVTAVALRRTDHVRRVGD